jgi:hypothetical protein
VKNRKRTKKKAPAKPVKQKQLAVAPGARARKSKGLPPGGRPSPARGTAGVPRSCGTAAVAHPEYAIADRQRPFVPHAHYHYFCGGGIVLKRLVIPSGWQLASPHPGPEYRMAALRSVPTPDGPVRIAKFVVRDEVRQRMAERCAAQIAEEQEHEVQVERHRIAVERIFTRVCGRESKRK